MNTIKKTFAAVAASALLSLTAACSGSTTALCAEATKAMTDYATQASGSAGNLDAFNKANSDLAAKLNDIAQKADGDLKTSLTKLADTLGSVKLDTSEPSEVIDM
jgi:hypothetical protein